MSNSDRGDLHSWIEKFSESVLGDLSRPAETDSRSCIFLDSQTINLLLVYMIMNKEMNVTQNDMQSSGYSGEIGKEIDALIAENKEQFEQLIKEIKMKF